MTSISPRPIPNWPDSMSSGRPILLVPQHKILQSELFASDDRYTTRQPVAPDSSSRERFESALERSEKLANQALATNQSDENALFALALVYGLRADYAALIEHHDFAALRFSQTGNGWAQKLLAISPRFYDAYVPTGIQKYLVSLKPAPVRWILRLRGIKGNQDEGIRELQLASSKGLYLGLFASILLAVAHLRKQEREEALTLLIGLREQLPHNSLFLEEVVKLQQQMSSAAQPSTLSNQSREKGQ